jgi:hypothetical protein
MEQAIRGLKDEKVSLSLLALVVLIAWYSFTWADEEFARKSDFEQLINVMTEHTEEFRIVTASQIIRDMELQLQVAEATGATESEIIHIKGDIADAKRYKQCLIDRKPNCKHMKPAE